MEISPTDSISQVVLVGTCNKPYTLFVVAYDCMIYWFSDWFHFEADIEECTAVICKRCLAQLLCLWAMYLCIWMIWLRNERVCSARPLKGALQIGMKLRQVDIIHFIAALPDAVFFGLLLLLRYGGSIAFRKR